MVSRGVWPCTPTPIKTWKKVTFPWRKVKNSGSWMKTVMGGHVWDDVVPIRIMEMKDLFRPLGFAWFEASMPVIMGLKSFVYSWFLSTFLLFQSLIFFWWLYWSWNSTINENIQMISMQYKIGFFSYPDLMKTRLKIRITIHGSVWVLKNLLNFEFSKCQNYYLVFF